MGIIAFFFIVLLIVILFGATLLHGILRLLLTILCKTLGLSRKSTGNQRRTHGNTSSFESQKSTGRKKKKDSSASPSRKKIFAEDEGEYVDFEEIKDQ